MNRIITAPGVPEPAGHYSPAVLVDPGKTWLFLSGQVATGPDGRIPEGIEEQTQLVWTNISRLLEAAGMGLRDIVKVNSYVVGAENLTAFKSTKSAILAPCKPASTLLVVSALAHPRYVVEVDVIAAQ